VIPDVTQSLYTESRPQKEKLMPRSQRIPCRLCHQYGMLLWSLWILWIC